MGSGKDNPTNPDSAYFGKSLDALRTANPTYYSYLTNPSGFDYTTAPTGLQNRFVLPGKNNDFNIDWDSITAPYKTAASAKAAQDAATAKAQAEADALAATQAAAAKRTGDISSARDIALRNASTEISNKGLDPNAYLGQATTSIDDLIKGLGDTADPYSTINGSSIADSVLNGAQSAARAKYSQEADTKLGTNYGDNLISDHLLDNTINDILGTQQSSAQDYLDRGLKRGIYNDVGYNAGKTALGNDASIGRSAVSGLANGVIDKYQTSANAIRDKAYGAVSGYNLGSTLNLDDYVKQGNDVLNNANTYASGDLRGAVGGTNYFDFGGLNQAAGIGQGATNLQDSDLAVALANKRKNDTASRGLGSQGAF